MSFPYQKINITLISDLHPRTQDILTRRFGLDEKEPATLEAIGQAHGITRERVRQIVEDGIRQVRDNVKQGKEQARMQEIFLLLSAALKEAGHVKRQDLLVESLNAQDVFNHIVFMLHLDDSFWKQKETEHVHPFWASKRDIFEASPAVFDIVLTHFRERNEASDLEELVNICKKGAGKTGGVKMSAQTLASLLEVSKHTTQGYNGKWGLREWPEVYPKGMRDKAYVVLKKTGEPLHFVAVAEAIESLQDALPDQKRKKILPQTVHNELIKDKRFVLVGRGTYALSEWGYEPGTVKDIITKILQEASAVMEKEEIIRKTLQQRQVKESTILLNLQDRASFLKDEAGRYYMRK